jgi:hypothetical protein
MIYLFALILIKEELSSSTTGCVFQIRISTRTEKSFFIPSPRRLVRLETFFNDLVDDEVESRERNVVRGVKIDQTLSFAVGGGLAENRWLVPPLNRSSNTRISTPCLPVTTPATCATPFTH